MELLPLASNHVCFVHEVFMHCGKLFCRTCYGLHVYNEHNILADYETWESKLITISEWLIRFEQAALERLRIERKRHWPSIQETVDSMSDKQLMELAECIGSKFQSDVFLT
jgi:hypothetical protein